MSKPSEKNPQIERFLENLFGRIDAITSDRCVWCGEDADSFRDELSWKEYTISGLCQSCQDKTFGVEEDV